MEMNVVRILTLRQVYGAKIKKDILSETGTREEDWA